jgi:heterotetrameric sarcosine oxidase delta subunit|tara:strand:+ start:1999 stop:2277 length:279 start_codon:yes stop_codon:yes gene_type:complete
MLEIKCPYCGKRSQNEFAYGGDATIKRPKLNTEVSDEEWDTFVYYRKNPRGDHLELWQHISGCRQWFKAKRNTATHEIIETYELSSNKEEHS